MSPIQGKTNAARILEKDGVPFDLVFYEVDPDDLGAEVAAAKIGLSPERVFKTLVVKGDGGVLLAGIPACAELDPKALARTAGVKRVELAPLKEVLPLTGYVRGGVSPLGTKRDYPFYLDASALGHESIAVSAGRRGCQLLLAPADLLRATGGRAARISR